MDRGIEREISVNVIYLVTIPYSTKHGRLKYYQICFDEVPSYKYLVKHIEDLKGNSSTEDHRDTLQSCLDTIESHHNRKWCDPKKLSNNWKVLVTVTMRTITGRPTKSDELSIRLLEVNHTFDGSNCLVPFSQCLDCQEHNICSRYDKHYKEIHNGNKPS